MSARKSLEELIKSFEPSKYLPCMALRVSIEGDAVELETDTSVDTYSEWIPGEGSDIVLIRCLETNKVVGVRLPLRRVNLAVFTEGPVKINDGFSKAESEGE